MNCPDHTSEVVYRMPLSNYDAASGIIREHVLLCKKCGQPVDITGQRGGKLSTKLQIRCPEHGDGERTVNNSLLDPILAAVPVKATPEAAVPAGTTKFCSSCGSPVPAPEALFCHNCGASIE
jgi:predicted amidophosphoribosyltransferase